MQGDHTSPVVGRDDLPSETMHAAPDPPALVMTQDAPDAATCVLTVRGEIDLGSAAPLKAAVREILDGGAHNLVIDLTATDFVDSAGLSVFIGAYKRLHAADGRLVIVNASPATAKTFEVTALDRVFQIVATREAALAAVRDGAR